MKKNRYTEIKLMVIAITSLIILFIIMLNTVDEIRGNARVINYSGIVRGASQRLVKKELYGKPDNEEIEKLDQILQGLKTGISEYDIKKLDNPEFQYSLDELIVEWDFLKNIIYDSRMDQTLHLALYDYSEDYFTSADKTVFLAEEYSVDLIQKLRVIEVLIFINISVVILALTYQIVNEVRENRRLKGFAYIDPNTGLPNKRSCEIELSKGGLLNENQNSCCFMFDLNNLKTVNDTMGHNAGDALISSFASILRRSAPPEMFIGRFGGDEFIGILENNEKFQIEEVLKNLAQEVSALNNADSENRIILSYASGYAHSSDYPNHTIKTLMDMADQNMYQNKAFVKQSHKQS